MFVYKIIFTCICVKFCPFVRLCLQVSLQWAQTFTNPHSTKLARSVNFFVSFDHTLLSCDVFSPILRIAAFFFLSQLCFVFSMFFSIFLLLKVLITITLSLALFSSSVHLSVSLVSTYNIYLLLLNDPVSSSARPVPFRSAALQRLKQICCHSSQVLALQHSAIRHK